VYQLFLTGKWMMTDPKSLNSITQWSQFGRPPAETRFVNSFTQLVD
jgi:hypothetical protein